MTLFHAEIELEGGEELGTQPLPTSPNGGRGGGLFYEHESLAGSDAIAAAGAGGGAVATAGALGGGGSVSTQQRVTSDREKNVGRNDPCWCGSGKKFKRCHGA
jgi:preprotein translocase subunit SecA